jgi:hypothetical protein
VFFVQRNPLNKIEQFKAFTEHGVSCPKWTTNRNDVESLGKVVFARQLINATNGRGIIEFNVGDEVPPAPLYTEYIPKKAEYRVHVMNGRAIDVQQKKKKRGFEGERDTRVRNCKNGYCYTRNDIVVPDGLLDLAVRAVVAVGYNYGAVDCIYNEKRNCCYVLEVNTRPGLTGTTIEKYAKEIYDNYN